MIVLIVLSALFIAGIDTACYKPAIGSTVSFPVLSMQKFEVEFWFRFTEEPNGEQNILFLPVRTSNLAGYALVLNNQFELELRFPLDRDPPLTFGGIIGAHQWNYVYLFHDAQQSSASLNQQTLKI